MSLSGVYINLDDDNFTMHKIKLIRQNTQKYKYNKISYIYS